LVPGGGGLKELVRRVISPVAAQEQGDPLAAANRLLQMVGMAKTSTSAAEAREMGFLGSRDRVVMHRDHLLSEAKQEVLSMVADGYLPPPPAKLWAGGRDLLAALDIAVWSLAQGGWASEHDALVARKIAWILAGGDLSSPQWVDEDYFLALERDAFAELVATQKTQARIRHMLETGKPLRN
jgi:3-hydroxyacyl-CoA dehydrogenase